MGVSIKVSLENIQIEAHTTEAKKFIRPMSPSPYHGLVPRTWADACNMGQARRMGPKGSAGRRARGLMGQMIFVLPP